MGVSTPILQRGSLMSTPIPSEKKPFMCCHSCRVIHTLSKGRIISLNSAPHSRYIKTPIK